MNDLWLYEPHNMLIVGITCCGKTHYVLDLLETTYKNHFDNIVIFCTTFEDNKTYDRKWISKDKNVYILDPELVELDLDKLLIMCVGIFKGSNTLFILDDCGNLSDTRKKKTELCKLAFSGRHAGISTWVIVQKYTSVVKDYRENIRMLTVFFSKDENSTELIFEENAIVPRHLRKEITERLKNNKLLKLVMRLEYPFKFVVLG